MDALILARAGSKRLPGKNIKKFKGKPCVRRAVEVAKRSCIFRKIYVSTDDWRVLAEVGGLGTTVYRRSDKNCSDKATMYDAFEEHTQRHGKANVCMIYPCSPLLRSTNLLSGYRVFFNRKAVIPVYKSGNESDNFVIKKANRHTLFNRSRVAPIGGEDGEYVRFAGSFWMVRTRVCLEKKTLRPDDMGYVIVDELDAQDINTWDDWQIAEAKWEMRKLVGIRR